MPLLSDFDPTKLRAVLADLGLSNPVARGVENLLILWHVAMDMHPAMSTDDPPPPLRGSELAVWERFYKEESFLFQFISEIVPLDRIEEIGQHVAERDDPRAAVDFMEVRPDGPIHQSLVGRFMRHVLFPYLFWNQDGPWSDYKDAVAGNEDALKRLLKIDENVFLLPDLMNRWKDWIENDSRLKNRLWESKNRSMDLVIEGVDPLLKKSTYRNKKSRFLARLALLLEDRGHPLNEPQLRRICNAFMAGWGLPSDPTLPESPEALSKAIQRHKKDFRRDFSSS
jgi:hypothetical protein